MIERGEKAIVALKAKKKELDAFRVYFWLFLAKCPTSQESSHQYIRGAIQ